MGEAAGGSKDPFPGALWQALTKKKIIVLCESAKFYHTNCPSPLLLLLLTRFSHQGSFDSVVNEVKIRISTR